MPQMGVSVSESTVTRWLKQAGDAISLDEPLLEISTDKVDTEVPSPGEGVVAEIRVQEGETVEVGTVLALIRPAGGEAAPPEPTPAPAGEQELVDEPQATQPEAEPVAEAPAEPASSASEPEVAEPEVAGAPVEAPAGEGNGRTFVSPVVARIAAQHGVDPGGIPGTGQGGRVTKKDILAFIESGAASAPTAPVPVPVAVEVAEPAPPPAEPEPAVPAVGSS